MSEVNVEMVRAMYADYQHGGWEAALAHLPPEFEWEADRRHPMAGVYRGRDAYRTFLEELEAPFERTDVEPEQFFDVGDRVLVFLRITRQPRGSTSAMEIHVASLFTVEDGKLV